MLPAILMRILQFAGGSFLVRGETRRRWAGGLGVLLGVCGLFGPGRATEPVIRTVGLMRNEAGAYPGYTLFAPMSYTNTYLIDNEGQLVRRWSSRYRPGNSAYLLSNGNLLRAALSGGPYFQGGGRGGRVEEYDWDGNLVWAFDYSDAQKRQHHDAIKLPNGNVLLIAWELKTIEQAVAAGRNPALISQGALWPDTLIEVQPTGSYGGMIVWAWHAWDHLIQDFDPAKANYGVVGDHPELVDLNYARSGSADWLHFNGLDYHPEWDQILVSSPFFNEIWIIDHSTTTAEAASHAGGRGGRGGDLLYRWGNPAAYRAGPEAGQRLFGQHNPQWIDPGRPGEGRILVFNNGMGRPDGNYSSVDEIIPSVNEAGIYALSTGGAYGPEAAAWSYRADPAVSFYASFISGAQRLPNGNTLVCHGPRGQFFEVSRGGVEHWRYVNPVGILGPVSQGETLPVGSVFRATRYGLDYEGVKGRDLTVLGTVELIPGQPFQVVEIMAAGDQVVVRWTSLPDRDYEVQYRPGLSGETWRTIGAVRALGTETVFRDTDAERLAEGRGFYRVREGM